MTYFKFHGIILQVVDIMKVNVEKVLERDSKLSELDTRAGINTTLIWIIRIKFYLISFMDSDLFGLFVFLCFQIHLSLQINLI